MASPPPAVPTTARPRALLGRAPSHRIPAAAATVPAPGRLTGHRLLLRRVGDAALVLVCVFSMTGAVAFASQHADGRAGAPPQGLLVLAWLGGVLACASLPLRRRHPVAVTVVTGAAAVLLPLDALAVLVVLPRVIAFRSARAAWWCGALAAAATAVALARDAARRPHDAVFSAADPVTGQVQTLPGSGYAVLGLLLLAVSVGTGLVRRSRHVATTAVRAEREQAHAVQELRAELTTELTRQDERDLIARELHDTVAHHLSIVSLRASALELTADGEQVQDAARSMRSSAHQALEEMRDLIAVLRDAQVPLTAGPMPGRSLADLADLVASARDGGADIAATVFVTDGVRAPAALTRAVYRIVQESLTNALKHAPHARVDLDLRAAPGDGVHVRVRNGMSPGQAPSQAPGSGTGLVGMRERASTVGGTVEAGPQGDAWVVTAHLPWPSAAPVSEADPTIQA
ncbi:MULTISPECIES: sensor histidine kinase [unclassified Actinotalea]|uniref:sensor histidine kinase n=1 Tax=unclassified Actinotalea TaxID=2638618 RepID=UPI0015F50C9C|nr:MULTISPECIES: histidine kinase [unclassified Actinotalea]